VEILNRIGTYESRTYSNSMHPIQDWTENGIIYCKENSVFETKYPNADIRGIAK